MDPRIKELIEHAAEYEERASAEDIDDLEREIMAERRYETWFEEWFQEWKEREGET